MSSSYLVCDIGLGCGGLGDRLVGLVSAILLARLSKRSLVIRWSQPIMDAIWENKYAPTMEIPVNDQTDIRWNFIDQRFKYQHVLQTQPLSTLWPMDCNVYLQGNQEIASFAYPGGTQNPDYLRDVTQVYATLFTDYLRVLKPSPLPPPAAVSLGLQIRTGDTHMNAGHVEYLSAQSLRQNVLPAVVAFIKNYSCPIKSVFVTSDFSQCAAWLDELLHADNYDTQVISNSVGAITHVDRPGATEAGLEKTVSDLQSLAACHVILFSWVSNFGRVAALMSHVHRTPLYTLHVDQHHQIQIVPIQSIPALVTKHQHSRDVVTSP